MATEYNFNEAYTFLVEAGLFQHHGKGNARTNAVPNHIKTGKNLDNGPTKNLTDAVLEQIQRINDPGTLSLPDLALRGDVNAADVLKKAVEVATMLNVEGAEEASEKLSTMVNGTGNNLTTDDSSTGNNLTTDNSSTGNNLTTDNSSTGNNLTTDNSSTGNNLTTDDSSTGKEDTVTPSTNPFYSIVDPVNKSAKDTWKEHGLQYVTTSEDGEEVTLLVQEKTERKSIRSKDGTVSYYHVEIKDGKTGKYQRKIKTAADVEPLLDAWNKLERKMVIHAGSKKEKFTRKTTGGVKKFHWYACRGLQRGNKDSMARDANTKCCVEFNLIKGVKVLLLNDLRQISGETKVNEWVEKSGDRDRQRLPREEEPRKYEEVNLAYDSDQGKRGRKGKTWRQVQRESYARRGIPLGDEAAAPQGETESRVQKVERRIDNLAQDFKDFKGHIDGLTEDFKDFKGALASIVKAIESTNTKLEKLGEDRQETKNAIKSLAERMDEISRGTRGDSAVAV